MNESELIRKLLMGFLNNHSLNNKEMRAIEINRLHYICLENMKTTTYFKVICFKNDKYLMKVKAFISKLQELVNVNPPIIIKGIAPYLATNIQAVKKISGDVDLICSDENILINMLCDMGFKQDDSPCDKHEFAHLYSENLKIELDLHKYFPILYRKNYDFDNCNLEMFPLDYSFLSQYCIKVDSIFVPSMEITTIIICAHVFKSFSWRAFVEPPFSFIEIHQIYKIVKDFRFDKKLFKELALKTNAIDSIAFVSSVINAFYNDNPLSFMDLSFLPYFKISNDSFGPWICSKDKNFFFNLPSRRFSDIIDSMIPNQIRLQEVYTSNNMMSIYRCKDNYAQNLDCDFRINWDYLTKYTVSIKINKELKNNDNIQLRLRNTAFGCHLWISQDDKNKFFFPHESLDAKYEIIKCSSAYLVNFIFYTKSIIDLPLFGFISFAAQEPYNVWTFIPFSII